MKLKITKPKLSVKNASVEKISKTLSKAEKDSRDALGKITEPIKDASLKPLMANPTTRKLTEDASKTSTKALKDITDTLKKGFKDTQTYFSTDKPLHKYNLEELMTGKIRPNGDPLASVSDKITEQVHEPIKEKVMGIGDKKKDGGGAGARPDLQTVMDTLFGPGGGMGGTTGEGGGTGSSAGPMGAITTPTFDPRFIEAQGSLLSQLQDRMSGKAPSLAELQYKQASNKAMQNSLGAVRAGVGGNAALAARTAALSGSNQMSDVAAQSAMLRLKESQDAQNAMAALATQAQAAQAQQQQIALDIQKANQAALLTQSGQANDLQRSMIDAKARIAASMLSPTQGGGGGGGTDWLDMLVKYGAPVLATAVGGPAAGAATAAATQAMNEEKSKSIGNDQIISSRPDVMDVNTPANSVALVDPIQNYVSLATAEDLSGPKVTPEAAPAPYMAGGLTEKPAVNLNIPSAGLSGVGMDSSWGAFDPKMMERFMAEQAAQKK